MTTDDVRAQAIEVLARLHGCEEWDDTQHDATVKRGQHAAIVRDIAALAEAGLLPTPSAGFAVLLTSDSGATSLSAAGSLAREMAEERVAYLRGGAFDARVVELREVAE